MDYMPKILADEKKYSNFVVSCANHISNNRKIKLVLIAGPSCSGKTTTTKLFSKHLAKLGIKSHNISIDDFYKNANDIPMNEDGSPDYESPAGFDIAKLHQCLNSLSDGLPTDIPIFDFTAGKVTGIRHTVIPDENSVTVLEGLHALNPMIYQNYSNSEGIYKIFLDCHTKVPSAMRYSRLIRRLVRDYKYRNSNAEKTFDLWKNVLVGEQKYIYPFIDFADIQINTRFDYEPHILKKPVLEVLNTLLPYSKYINFAQDIQDYLKDICTIPSEFVPADSLLQEFL